MLFFSRRLKLPFVWACALCVLSLFALPLTGQQGRWEELNARVEALYQQGNYVEATAVAQEAVRLAEASFGPNDPRVATSLNNLAGLYRDQGKHSEAEPFFKRALAVREMALGPNHPVVAIVLDNYAALLRKINREAEAAKMEARANAIRAKQGQ